MNDPLLGADFPRAVADLSRYVSETLSPKLARQMLEVSEQLMAQLLVTQDMGLSPLERLSKVVDEEYQERLQRAWDLVNAESPGERPPLHTWRLLRGKRGRPRQLGYLLEWIDPVDPTGCDVMVLPGYPGAEPVPSRWRHWTEGVDLLTSLAIEGALAEGKAVVILKTK